MPPPFPPNTNGLIYVQKMKEKQIIYVTHQQKKITELHAPDLEQAHTCRIWRG